MALSEQTLMKTCPLNPNTSILTALLQMCFYSACLVYATRMFTIQSGESSRIYRIPYIFAKVSFENRNKVKSNYSLFLHTNHTNGFGYKQPKQENASA